MAINRQELQYVLVNPLVNAVDAMPEDGTLELAMRDMALADGTAGVEIEVADSGPGIAPELLGRQFQPFVTRKKDGAGLGPWISRNLVVRYGGDIVANNRPGGGGAIVTVRPRAESTWSSSLQVVLETLMVGNLAEKSLAFSAICTATERAICR